MNNIRVMFLFLGSVALATLSTMLILRGVSVAPHSVWFVWWTAFAGIFPTLLAFALRGED